MFRELLMIRFNDPLQRAKKSNSARHSKDLLASQLLTTAKGLLSSRMTSPIADDGSGFERAALADFDVTASLLDGWQAIN